MVSSQKRQGPIATASLSLSPGRRPKGQSSMCHSQHMSLRPPGSPTHSQCMLFATSTCRHCRPLAWLLSPPSCQPLREGGGTAPGSGTRCEVRAAGSGCTAPTEPRCTCWGDRPGSPSPRSRAGLRRLMAGRLSPGRGARRGEARLCGPGGGFSTVDRGVRSRRAPARPARESGAKTRVAPPPRPPPLFTSAAKVTAPQRLPSGVSWRRAEQPGRAASSQSADAVPPPAHRRLRAAARARTPPLSSWGPGPAERARESRRPARARDWEGGGDSHVGQGVRRCRLGWARLGRRHTPGPPRPADLQPLGSRGPVPARPAPPLVCAGKGGRACDGEWGGRGKDGWMKDGWTDGRTDDGRM
jgi:hypothetical protein